MSRAPLGTVDKCTWEHILWKCGVKMYGLKLWN